jgi:type I restriction enzyme S subunit
MEAVDDVTGAVTSAKIQPYHRVARGYTYFEEADIIFAKITPCMQNGKTAIVTDLIDGIGFGSTEFHVLRARAGVDRRWIYYLLRSAEFRRKAEENFEGSAGQRRVPDDFLRTIHVPSIVDGEMASKLMAKLDSRMANIYEMRCAAERQLEAISVLPSATLSEFFSFRKNDGHS